MNNDNQHTVTQEKLLGVIIDNNLTWSQQTEKMTSNLWFL